MSGSGMISAIPDGLADRFDGFMQFDGLPVAARPAGMVAGGDVLPSTGCVTIDDRSDPGSWGQALAAQQGARPETDVFAAHLRTIRAAERQRIALGLLCHAAARCTDVRKMADRHAIDPDSGDLFIRRYSESICDVILAIAEMGDS